MTDKFFDVLVKELWDHRVNWELDMFDSSGPEFTEASTTDRTLTRLRAYGVLNRLEQAGMVGYYIIRKENWKAGKTHRAAGPYTADEAYEFLCDEGHQDYVIIRRVESPFELEAEYYGHDE